MGKRTAAIVLDQALNYYKAQATKQVVCSAEPTNYTQASATYMLAEVVTATGDFTIANGDGGGNTPRKLTVAAKSTTVTNAGTPTHIALLDTANLVVLEVTTCTATALNASDPLVINSWKIEYGAPT